MDKETFETIDPILSDIAGVATALLKSAATKKLQSLLTELTNILGKRYLVNLHINVTVFDAEMARCLPVLQTAFSGFDRDKPYQAVGGSSPQHYIVDGELLVVPHDRCPQCWGKWDFTLRHSSCPHCGVSLGKEVKILLDTDVCPNCEEGTVSVSHPQCGNCGSVVELSQVAWG